MSIAALITRIKAAALTVIARFARKPVVLASTDCMTYSQAVEWAESFGGRLPTLNDLISKYGDMRAALKAAEDAGYRPPTREEVLEDFRQHHAGDEDRFGHLFSRAL